LEGGRRYDRAGASCCEAGQGSFADQVPFELGECREDMEDKPSLWKSSLNLLGERLEAYLALFEVTDHAHEIGKFRDKTV
jgi:hypothetical protein